MKFKNTVHLSKADIIRLRTGQIRLQVGQWVWLPFATSRSRYMGISASRKAQFLHSPVSYYDVVKQAKIKRYKFGDQILLFAI